MSLLPTNATKFERDIESNINTRLSALPINARHNKNPELIDNDLLDLFAEEFHVDFWDNKWSEAKKREIVKASVETHRFKGTLHGVKKAIEVITQDYSIIEWFHPAPTLPLKLPAILATGTGAPNTVDIHLSDTSSVADTKEVLISVDNSKPLHVHASVIILQSASANLHLVASGYAESHLTILGNAA